MQTMTPEMSAYALKLAIELTKRIKMMNSDRVADRRVKAVAITHEDRRIGPRRWVEKRALMARQNVEND